MDDQNDNLAELMRAVIASEKYARISPDLIRELGKKELGKRRNLKEAVKETRNKLHQIGSAYQEKPIPYALWMEELNELPADLTSDESIQYVKKNMSMHASTAERLSILSNFFKETLVSIGKIHSILDLACGLNPLAIPWMPVADDLDYTACDIYEDMTDYLTSFFAHFGINGHASVCDLTSSIPQTNAQVAFLLKTVPCLDQVDKTTAKRLLQGLKAEHILVSFPAHSLGGRAKGMLRNYETRFWDLVEGENWKVTRFEHTSELAFLIQK